MSAAAACFRASGLSSCAHLNMAAPIFPIIQDRDSSFLLDLARSNVLAAARATRFSTFSVTHRGLLRKDRRLAHRSLTTPC